MCCFGPSPTVKEMLEQAHDQINAARGGDATKKSKLCQKAGDTIKKAEKKFNKEKVVDDTLRLGIANAYHAHSILLEDMRQKEKAKKSHGLAQKLGHICPATRMDNSFREGLCPSIVHKTDSGHSLPNNGEGSKDGEASKPIIPECPTTKMENSFRESPCSSSTHMTDSGHSLPKNGEGTKDDEASKPVIPECPTTEMNNSFREGPYSSSVHKTDNGHSLPKNGEDSKDGEASKPIFPENKPPIFKLSFPETDRPLVETTQLAYCLQLLRTPSLQKNGLAKSEREWLEAKAKESHEVERLETLATDILSAFLSDGRKDPVAMKEVVCLSTVLKLDDLKKLQNTFIDTIKNSTLLDTSLLEGLALSIQTKLDSDDLVKILQILNQKAQGTHPQSKEYPYRLALAISSILDSMKDNNVEGLKRETLHEPLSAYLIELQGSTDPCLIYQAAYASQALLYIPDDESDRQEAFRKVGDIIKGISGVTKAVKAFDIAGMLDGLGTISNVFDNAYKTVGVIASKYKNGKDLLESGQNLLEALKQGFSFKKKAAWYPALRALDALIRNGQFHDFEKLVRQAVCNRDPAFQWG
ncbi:hypothetical protein BGX27_004444, partial [Mortierella sp. AM989]